MSEFAGHATHELLPTKALYLPAARASHAQDAFWCPATQRQSSASAAPSKLVVSGGAAGARVQARLSLVGARGARRALKGATSNLLLLSNETLSCGAKSITLLQQ